MVMLTAKAYCTSVRVFTIQNF